MSYNSLAETELADKRLINLVLILPHHHDGANIVSQCIRIVLSRASIPQSETTKMYVIGWLHHGWCLQLFLEIKACSKLRNQSRSAVYYPPCIFHHICYQSQGRTLNVSWIYCYGSGEIWNEFILDANTGRGGKLKVALYGYSVVADHCIQEITVALFFTTLGLIFY
jgi:hypothetical protein